MKNDKFKSNHSNPAKPHLHINGKTKKTTSKHLKKLSRSDSTKKNAFLCSTCNQLLDSSHYSQEQNYTTSDLLTCHKCLRKLEKKKRNKEIVTSIRQMMGIEFKSVNKTHRSLSHETRERRKNKGVFRLLVLERDQYRCHYCNEYGDTVDHMLPIAKGGYTTLENCVCSCEFCNHIKTDIDLEDFVTGFASFDKDEWRQLKSEWKK